MRTHIDFALHYLYEHANLSLESIDTMRAGLVNYVLKILSKLCDVLPELLTSCLPPVATLCS